MFIEQPPLLFRLLFHRAVCRVKGKSKAIFLTFDDGPCAETTPEILKILETYGVKATFFCVGENVQRNADLFAEIRKRGHSVGNHTMHHANGFRLCKKAYIADVEQAARLIESRLFRPPYGRISPAQYHSLLKKYKIVLWDVVTRDYNPNLSPERVLQNVRRYARNGSVIVFHDSKKAAKNVLGALPGAIEFLQKNGYKFLTLDEI